MRLLRWILLASVAACAACGDRGAPAPPPEPKSAALTEAEAREIADAAAPDHDGALERADRLVAIASAMEPRITQALQDLALRLGGELVKLDYRLKKRASTVRKLREKVALDPGLKMEELTLNDSLRYTMLAADSPRGRYVSSVREALGRLEAQGHRVARLRNYWPRGDSYSGVNVVLIGDGDGRWELQLHTPGSYEASSRTRDMYEELRRMDTAPGRRQQLFDEMVQIWNDVDTPLGVLQPGSLHRNEEIVQIPRPR